jgi:hypothetical protein
VFARVLARVLARVFARVLARVLARVFARVLARALERTSLVETPGATGVLATIAFFVVFNVLIKDFF